MVRRSRPDIAGKYGAAHQNGRRHPCVSTGDGNPGVDGEFGRWLKAATNHCEAAFAAHLALVKIHPLNHGNGRTARLLMNLIFNRGGFPPITVRPEDRPEYLRSLQAAQSGMGSDRFEALLYGRLDTTLADYRRALREGMPPKTGKA